MLIDAKGLLIKRLNPVSAELAAGGATHLLAGLVLLPDGGASLHIASQLSQAERPSVLRAMAEVMLKRADDIEESQQTLIIPKGGLSV